MGIWEAIPIFVGGVIALIVLTKYTSVRSGRGISGDGSDSGIGGDCGGDSGAGD